MKLKHKLTMTADLKGSASDVSKSAASTTDNLPDVTQTISTIDNRQVPGRYTDGIRTEYG